MQCPYCLVTIKPVVQWSKGYKEPQDEDGLYNVEATMCPACERIALTLEWGDHQAVGVAEYAWVAYNSHLVWPRKSTREPIPSQVPEEYASLAREAGLILNDSPRASAALSRRCLQQLLRSEAKAPKADLYKEIEWVLQNGSLPAHASESLHDLREVGNMAAHPNKSLATGEIVDVEPGEAEWALDTLDALFDFYFVAPAKTAARKAALQAKLSGTKKA